MKRSILIYTFAVSALIVLIPALIALNMLVVSFPEWVMLIPIALLAAADVLFVLKSGAKPWTRLVVLVFSVLAIAGGLFGSCCNPYWSSVSFRSVGFSEDFDTVLTDRQAQEDMAQMLSLVSRDHPAFIDGVTADFSAAYDSSVQRLHDDGEITVNDLYREIQRTLSVLSDGHTTLYSNHDNELYLRSVAGRQAEGWSFYAVNGSTPEQLFEEKRELFCYEAESWGIRQLKSKVSTVSGLDFLGIDADGVQFTWTNSSGEMVTDTHSLSDFVTLDEYLDYNAAYASGDDGQAQDFVRYSIDSERNLAVLTLTSCVYNDEYIDCLNRFFTEVRDRSIGNVAVDIRGNGGGSSLVVNEFIRYLDVDSYKVDGYRHRLGFFMPDFTGVTTMENEKYTDLLFDGDVYVLTDSGSFSSAMMFAMYIKDNRLGTLIGEAPGNAPNGYGEVATFRLKHSGLILSVSTKEFLRADRECTDRLVQPDIECRGSDAMDVLLDIITEN